MSSATCASGRLNCTTTTAVALHAQVQPAVQAVDLRPGRARQKLRPLRLRELQRTRGGGDLAGGAGVRSSDPVAAVQWRAEKAAATSWLSPVDSDCLFWLLLGVLLGQSFAAQLRCRRNSLRQMLICLSLLSFLSSLSLLLHPSLPRLSLSSPLTHTHTRSLTQARERRQHKRRGDRSVRRPATC